MTTTLFFFLKSIPQSFENSDHELSIGTKFVPIRQMEKIYSIKVWSIIYNKKKRKRKKLKPSIMALGGIGSNCKLSSLRGIVT